MEKIGIMTFICNLVMLLHLRKQRRFILFFIAFLSLNVLSASHTTHFYQYSPLLSIISSGTVTIQYALQRLWVESVIDQTHTLKPKSDALRNPAQLQLNDTTVSNNSIDALAASIVHGGSTSKETTAPSSQESAAGSTESHSPSTLNISDWVRQLFFWFNQTEDDPSGNPPHLDHTPEKNLCLACNNKPCRLKSLDYRHLNHQAQYEAFESDGPILLRDKVNKLIAHEQKLPILTVFPGTNHEIYKKDVSLLAVDGKLESKYIKPFLFWNSDKECIYINFNNLDLIHILYPELFLTPEVLPYFEEKMAALYQGKKNSLIGKHENYKKTIEALFQLYPWITFLAEIGKHLRDQVPESYKNIIQGAQANGHLSNFVHYYQFDDINDEKPVLDPTEQISKSFKYNYSLPNDQLLASIKDYKFQLEEMILKALGKIYPENQGLKGAPIYTGALMSYLRSPTIYSWLATHQSVVKGYFNNLGDNIDGSFTDMIRFAKLVEVDPRLRETNNQEDFSNITELFQSVVPWLESARILNKDRDKTICQAFLDYSIIPLSPLFFGCNLSGMRFSHFLRQLFFFSKDNKELEKTVIFNFSLNEGIQELESILNNIEFFETLVVIYNFRSKEQTNALALENGFRFHSDGLQRSCLPIQGVSPDSTCNAFHFDNIIAFNRAQSDKSYITIYFRNPDHHILCNPTRSDMENFKGVIVQWREDQKESALEFFKHILKKPRSNSTLNWFPIHVPEKITSLYCDLAIKLDASLDDFVKHTLESGRWPSEGVENILTTNKNLLSVEAIFAYFESWYDKNYRFTNSDQHYKLLCKYLDKCLQLKTDTREEAAQLKLDFYRTRDVKLLELVLLANIESIKPYSYKKFNKESDIVFEASQLKSLDNNLDKVSFLINILLLERQDFSITETYTNHSFAESLLYIIKSIPENSQLIRRINDILKTPFIESSFQNQHSENLSLESLKSLFTFLSEHSLLIDLIFSSSEEDIFGSNNTAKNLLLEAIQHYITNYDFSSFKENNSHFDSIFQRISTVFTSRIGGWDLTTPLYRLFLKMVTEVDFISHEMWACNNAYPNNSFFLEDEDESEDEEYEDINHAVLIKINNAIATKNIHLLEMVLPLLKNDELIKINRSWRQDVHNTVQGVREILGLSSDSDSESCSDSSDVYD